jgi:hypothetical protein
MSLRLRALLFVVVLSLAPLRGIASVYAHAQTPEEAAIRTVYAAPGKRVTVLRENRAGRHAMMEGSAMTAPILVERFPFGWQALDVANFRCRIIGHGLDAATVTALMRGMPPPADDAACGESSLDVGPSDEIEAVRAMDDAFGLHPRVAVAGGYALASWYGGGGGEHLYARRHGHWTFIAGGGGAMDAGILHSFGVSPAASCVLLDQLQDAAPNCPRRKT